jgi:ABC-type phosphate/phosphonate transport system substrate-binding protein
MEIVRQRFYLLILILIIGLFSPAVSAAGPYATPFSVGYSIKSIAGVDPTDIEAALRIWSDDIGRQHGFRVETTLYESVDKLSSEFVNKKLDFALMTTIDYLRMKDILKVKPELTQLQNGKTTVKYLVLATADFQEKGLAGLKSKKLAILKTDHLGLMFLDTLLMQSKLPRAEYYFAETRWKLKQSQAILDVFFGQADICVVTDSAFQTMTELNPKVRSKLRVIAESPDLIGIVGFFRPDYPPDHKQRAIQGMSSDFKHNERGRQIMLLFNVERMAAITDSQLESARELLAEYSRLKRK